MIITTQKMYQSYFLALNILIATPLSGMFEISHGSASLTNEAEREENEDRALRETFTVDGKEYLVAGIYDGHGGKKAATYASENITSKIKAHMQGASAVLPAHDLESIVKKSLEKIEEELLANEENSGTTALTFLITPTHVLIANIGDSRAICALGNTIVATSDHKPGDDVEKKRIIENGGYIEKDRIEFGKYTTSFSRSLGDSNLKQVKKNVLIASPDITKRALKNNSIFILASDGIWDVVSNKEALEVIKECLKEEKTLDQAAHDLCEKAIEIGSQDNVTAIVITIKEIEG